MRSARWRRECFVWSHRVVKSYQNREIVVPMQYVIGKLHCRLLQKVALIYVLEAQRFLTPMWRAVRSRHSYAYDK